MHYPDLFQSGQIDLENSEKQFEEEEYMLSAFLAQQALEKHVKAYLLKNDIFDNIKKLGHLPISAVINRFMDHYKETTNKPGGLYSESSMKFFEHISEYLLKLEREDSLKIIIWKKSLGIPLTKDESNKEQGSSVKSDQFISEFETSMPDFASQLKNQAQLDPLNQGDTSQLDDKEQSLIKYLDKTYDVLTKKSTFTCEDIEHIIHDTGYGSGKNSLAEIDTNKIKEFIKIIKSLQWMDEIVSSYPHQTLARYPFKIDGKTNHDWYIKYKDNLKELITKIKTTCEDIRKTE